MFRQMKNGGVPGNLNITWRPGGKLVLSVDAEAQPVDVECTREVVVENAEERNGRLKFHLTSPLEQPRVSGA